MPQPKRRKRELRRLVAEKRQREEALKPVLGLRPADGMQPVDEVGIDARTGKPACNECGDRRGRIVFVMPEGKPDTWPDGPYWEGYDSPAESTEGHAAQSKLL